MLPTCGTGSSRRGAVAIVGAIAVVAAIATIRPSRSEPAVPELMDQDNPQPVVYSPEELPWEERSSGVRVALLYGSPEMDGDFVLRLEYPPGYRKDPHYHPGDAHVSVLEGGYFRGYGTVFDRSKAFTLATGTFSLNPAGVSHYEWSEEPAVLQVYAAGPWKTVYVDGSGNPLEMSPLPVNTTFRLPVVLKSDEIVWEGGGGSVRRAILAGDPQGGGAFTSRIELAPGHKQGPHAHGSTAFVTVLSGSLFLGFGNEFSKDGGRELTAGAFAVIPKGAKHFEWTPGGAVVELHSIGPWTTTNEKPAPEEPAFSDRQE